MKIQWKAIVVAVILFSLVHAPHVYAQDSSAPQKQAAPIVSRDPALETISKEWEGIFEIIDENYLEPVDHYECYAKTQSGGLSACLDKYSEYFSAKEWEKSKADLNRQYAGVGMVIERDSNVLRAFPYPGTPAAKAGILPNDILLKVDSAIVVLDHNYTESDQRRVVQLIRGQPGTVVQITVRRGDETLGPFSVTRENIQISSVIYQKLAPNVGYIKINSFGASTAQDFSMALKSLTNNGTVPMSFIFDVRGNGGGWLDAVLNMLELLSPAGGKLMITEEFKTSSMPHATRDRGTFSDARGVILTNEFSASASEIFAGVLQDWGTFKLVGEHTYGKGIGQSTIPLSRDMFGRPLKDSPFIKLTTFRYLVGDNKKPVLEGKGLTPNYEVSEKLTPDETKQLQEDLKKSDPTKLYINLTLDKQLAKALELLTK